MIINSSSTVIAANELPMLHTIDGIKKRHGTEVILHRLDDGYSVVIMGLGVHYFLQKALKNLSKAHAYGFKKKHGIKVGIKDQTIEVSCKHCPILELVVREGFEEWRKSKI